MDASIRRYRIWVVDDNDCNINMVINSLRDIADSIDLIPIESCAAFRQRLTTINDMPPNLILMDFFMGKCTGSRLIMDLKRSLTSCLKPVIIAHSSVNSANDRMLEVGADFKLDKKPPQTYSAPLAQAIGDLAQLEFVLKHRKPMRPVINKWYKL